MLELWRQGLRKVVRVLMPEVCAGCGISGSWICSNCFQHVQTIEQSLCCRQCGMPSDRPVSRCRRCRDWPPGVLEVRSVFLFDSALQRSVHRMKYRGEYARAEWHGPQLAALLNVSGWSTPDILVPVALHARKQKSRGYNQAEYLARHFSAAAGVPTVDALTRIRNTSSQAGLTGDARRTNVVGAFVCNDQVAGRHVLLVDDVVTTGETLLACAEACRDAGAASVRAVTVATAV